VPAVPVEPSQAIRRILARADTDGTSTGRRWKPPRGSRVRQRPRLHPLHSSCCPWALADDIPGEISATLELGLSSAPPFLPTTSVFFAGNCRGVFDLRQSPRERSGAECLYGPV